MKMSLEEFHRRMEKWADLAPRELRRMLRKAGQMVVAHSQKNYLTGPRPEKLGVISNTLRGSIHSKTKDETGRITLMVGTNVWYGRRHEFGEGTRERPFLRPAIRDKQAQVMRMLADAMMEGYKKSG
jgi:HK97 gp10 family phage protein